MMSKRRRTKLDIPIEPSQKQQLQRQARKNGLSLSAYVRECLAHPTGMSPRVRRSATQLLEEISTVLWRSAKTSDRIPEGLVELIDSKLVQIHELLYGGDGA